MRIRLHGTTTHTQAHKPREKDYHFISLETDARFAQLQGFDIVRSFGSSDGILVRRIVCGPRMESTESQVRARPDFTLFIVSATNGLVFAPTYYIFT